MSRSTKILIGARAEHWLDKRLREHKPINCPGNYIRIPAVAWLKFQEFKNRSSGKHQSLREASHEFEKNHGNTTGEE